MFVRPSPCCMALQQVVHVPQHFTQSPKLSPQVRLFSRFIKCYILYVPSFMHCLSLVMMTSPRQVNLQTQNFYSRHSSSKCIFPDEVLNQNAQGIQSFLQNHAKVFVCVWFSFHLFLARDGDLYTKMNYPAFSQLRYILLLYISILTALKYLVLCL